MLTERAEPLPQGWSVSRIGEFAVERKQRAGHGAGLPVLSVTKHHGLVRSDQFFSKRVHGKDTSNYKVVYPGQFAYATIHLNEGSIGLLPDPAPGIVSPMYTVFDVHNSIDPDYLFAALKSKRSLSVYQKITQGTVNRRGGISFRTLSGLLLHHPPLPEQRKIAAILSSVDDAIEKTQAVIDQVQVVKRGLMQQLFTRGLPGRHTRFKQTEIGDIPAEWEVLPLVDLAEPVNGIQTGPFGSQLHASEYVDSGVPVVMPKDMMNGRVSDGNSARIADYKVEELNRHRVRGGDILFARRGDIGRLGLITQREEGWVCGTGCFRFRPKDRALSRFLVQWIAGPGSVRWLNEHAVGQTMLNLNTSILGRLPIALPSEPERSVIVDVLEELSKWKLVLEQNADGLGGVKRSLLSVLLTGELRVTPDPKGA